MLLSEIPKGYFSGAGHVDTGELETMLRDHGSAVRSYHAPAVSPSTYRSPGLKDPTLIDLTPLILLQFTPNVDAAFRSFKIPGYYSQNAEMHLHWTKSSDANESGKAVRWRIEYFTFSGNGDDLITTPSSVEIEDIYDDAGTTSRIVHRTPNVALTGFQARWYAAIAVSAVTPVGTAMASEPALFSADLTFDQFINE